jgi:predicted Rossmann fold nucleotide-binding protein DprA/Smf involved in DNA uptake
MRLGVTGSRHWNDSAALFRALDDVRPVPVVVIHGGARGADLLAKAWAQGRGIATAEVSPARRYVKADYLRRNKIIVDMADYVIAFRADGKSDGTDDTIRAAERTGKLIAIITPIPTDAKTDQDTQKVREE